MKESNAKKNLILTIVEKLKFAEIEPFFTSLRSSGYKGDLVVFSSRLNSETSAMINHYGAEVIPFKYFSIRYRHPILILWPLWRRIFARYPDFDRKLPLARRVFNLFFLRFLLYYEFLLSAVDRYSHVLLTDCRDVLFQLDPFSWNYEPGLHCFLESEGRSIGSCPWNTQMVKTSYGKTVLAELGRMDPSCAGVTLGTSESVLAYLYRMIDQSFRVRIMPMIPGTDQGVHNYLVHKELVEDLHLHKNGTSGVLTMGTMKTADVRTNGHNQVINYDGTVPPILHQYDRHAAIAKMLLRNVKI